MFHLIYNYVGQNAASPLISCLQKIFIVFVSDTHVKLMSEQNNSLLLILLTFHVGLFSTLKLSTIIYIYIYNLVLYKYIYIPSSKSSVPILYLSLFLIDFPFSSFSGKNKCAIKFVVKNENLHNCLQITK